VAVIYARVSSRGTGEGGLFHPGPVKMLTDCAVHEGLAVVPECIDMETAKTVGRTSFGSMVGLSSGASVGAGTAG